MADDALRAALGRHATALDALARASLEAAHGRPAGCATLVVRGKEILVPLDGVVDLQAEADRLTKVLAKAEEDAAVLGKRMANPEFVEKAPAEKVQELQDKLDAATERLAVLLSAAREEALVRGRPVRLAIDGSGYRFLVLADRQWRSFDEAPLAPPRRWEGPTTSTVTRSDGRTALEFGREPVDVPILLVLEREGARVAVAGNGLGRFDVLR